MYNYMISALGRAGRIEEVIDLKREMESRKIRPDSYTYSALISAYSKVGRGGFTDAPCVTMKGSVGV